MAFAEYRPDWYFSIDGQGLTHDSTGVHPSEVTLDELTEGSYHQSGRRIYEQRRIAGTDRYTYRRIFDLPSDFAAFMVIHDEGRYSFGRSVNPASFQAYSASNTHALSEIEFDHYLPSGDTVHIGPIPVSLTAIGTRLYARTEANGTLSFREVLAGPGGTADRDAARLAGYRLATYSEGVTRAITRYLIRYQESFLNQVLDSGEIDKSGNYVTDRYAAATYLAQMYGYGQNVAIRNYYDIARAPEVG